MNEHGCTKASIPGYDERGRSDGRNLGAGQGSHHHIPLLLGFLRNVLASVRFVHDFAT